MKQVELLDASHQVLAIINSLLALFRFMGEPRKIGYE